MSLERVQEVVEALGTRLGRGVTVDDHTMRLVASGPDFNDSDPARVWAVLNKRTRPEDVDYATLRSLTGPHWVPGDPDVQLYPRMCIPVRHDGGLFGFLWIIDRDSTLSEADVADGTMAADEIGRLLRERLALQDRDSALADYLLRQMISSDPEARTHAAAEALSHGMIRDDSHVAVLLGRPSGPDVSGGFAAVVREACRRQPPFTYLIAASERSAVVLLAERRPVGEAIGELAQRIVTAAARVGEPDKWRVAVGAPTQGLGAVARAYRQASIALRMAEQLPEFGPLVCWDELGPWALLGQWPESVLYDDVQPAGLTNLLRVQGAAQLLNTLEVFLDEAGDKQATARRLGVHRTTLYARLDRIEAVSGMSMSDGRDRLLLHLATKLHRLRPTPD